MKTFFCAAATLFFLSAAAYFSLPILETEGKTYFYAGRSSLAEMVGRADYIKTYDYPLSLLSVKAESAYVPGECEVDKLLEKYSAKVLFSRESEGLKEYYCFSSKMRAGISVRGRTVNLHIAVAKDGYSIGTPLIFGGY
ncbi:MAG: hypothetical protein J6126_02365 [Clostridia bacterium]|nr:hypothetical protein [Clostridia bacterium]